MILCFLYCVHICYRAGKVAVSVDSVGWKTGKSNSICVNWVGCNKPENIPYFLCYFRFYLVRGIAGFPSNQVDLITQFFRFFSGRFHRLVVVRNNHILVFIGAEQRGVFRQGFIFFFTDIMFNIFSDRCRRLIPDSVSGQDLLGFLKRGIIPDGWSGSNDGCVVYDSGFGYRHVWQHQGNKSPGFCSVLAHSATFQQIDVFAYSINFVNCGWCSHQ